MGAIILRILLVALVVVILGVWGIVKEQNKNNELLINIYGKVEKKILKLLKKNGKMTFNQLKYEIDGVKGSLFWSKKKIKITDSKIFTRTILDKLIGKNLICKEVEGNKEFYKYNT